MATHAVTDASFKADVLEADTPVLLDFWAEWCGPCKKMGPALEDVSDEFEGRLKIAKMDIQENPGTPGKFHVRGIPTLMIFKGCLLYTSPSPRDRTRSRMPSSA